MSSPKEKAKELYNKMHELLPRYAYITAKECTLAAIDEILKCVQDEEGYIYNTEYTSAHHKYKSYWLLVREEVKKL